MTIPEYLSSIKFDNYKLYYRDYNYFDLYFIDSVYKTELIDRNKNLLIENSIINFEGSINETFNFIASSSNIVDLKQLADTSSNKLFPVQKNSFYDIGILFELGEQIVGGINLDVRNRLAKDIKSQNLLVSYETLDILKALYNKHNCLITKRILPPSIPIYDYWRNYEFPFDFFYNSVYEMFECRINTGLMSLNFVHAQLNIEPIGETISPKQIKRVYELEDKKYFLNNYLKEKFWDIYNMSKDDYELPDLTDKEQLYYFIKVNSISIPSNEDKPIIISFRTWDFEHGETVYYYNDDKIEFR